MKFFVALALVVALAGCGLKQIYSPEARRAAEEAQKVADDSKCRELGLEPKTEAYAKCRLKLEEIRAINQAAASRQATSSRAQQNTEGVSFMCKDAIARGDSGGVRTFC